MNAARRQPDAVVIGGGFYGCEVALALREIGLGVTLIEREGGLLRRASFVNQARVHNGYHYPRSLATAISSRRNFIRFCNDYAFAVERTPAAIYAVARDSRVSPDQFERFCRAIGAPFQPLGPRRLEIFNPDLILEAYEVQECAFDAAALTRHLEARLADADVETRFRTAARIAGISANNVTVEAGGERLEPAFVFNCTYAGLDAVGVPLAATLKRELAEIALIEAPRSSGGLGVTVIDGPFFSTMPFPAYGCFSLSHVRYTPHRAWTDASGSVAAPAKSNAVAMLRDSARYMPALARARHLRSLFDVKSVLAATEENDGRPILFERDPEHGRVISILGAKIDNIYDVRALIRSGDWMREAVPALAEMER